METIDIVALCYVIFGLGWFTGASQALSKKPRTPLAFYTIGLICVVIVWPLFLIDGIESWAGSDED